MGACMSTWMILDPDHVVYLPTPSAAHVITLNGELRQFPTPITVSQLLVQLESSSSSSSSFFLCNSDSLSYYENIPALNPTSELKSGQIYFVLPKSKLNYPLSTSDMAALAVKASTAISEYNKKTSSGKSQICPLMASIQLATEGDVNTNMNMSTKIKKSLGGGLRISRSGSMGNLQRYSARRPKLLPTRSFQQLTTIHEASDLQAY
ncbi:Poly polymerase [Heracleum sosnowskyi]|uniref:Poly polymerase n=1 Tax=Heracleum sosnowskyi TaxID=360622 RepID=A0AAD8IPS5_9APIA|nr:Poly polymerase [Heracleum sosnowskyi]